MVPPAARPAMARETARNHLAACAEIVAVAGPGGTIRLPVLRSQVPLVLRRTPEAVYLVGGAAGPLGGDRLDLRIEVRAGATLRLRTAAASVALPGLDPVESVLAVTAAVEPGARLEYLPEPVVVADGARHATDIRVTLAEGAALVLREELILGRYGERGGAYRGSLQAEYAGRPLLRQCLEVNGTREDGLGPAVLSGHRAVGSLLCAGPDALKRVPAASACPDVAVMSLAGPGVLVTALADDAVALRRHLGFHDHDISGPRS